MLCFISFFLLSDITSDVGAAGADELHGEDGLLEPRTGLTGPDHLLDAADHLAQGSVPEEVAGLLRRLPPSGTRCSAW